MSKRLYRATVEVLVYYWSEPGSQDHDAERAAEEAIRDSSAFDMSVWPVECKAGETCDQRFGIPFGDPPTRGDERTVPEVLAALARGEP